MKDFWKNLGKMIKNHWLTLVLIVILVLIVGVGLLVKYGMEKAQADEILAKFPDRGVPRMNITLNGVSLEEINAGSKDAKYEGNELAVYEGDKVTLEAGEVRVKGRGNMTWLGEKKPYQLKFANKTDMFGMGKARKWALLANATDVTNLRNDVAFCLEQMLEMKPFLEGVFVELYFNDKYVGLYYLTQVVEISKQSVSLSDPMGVLVELDNLYWNSEKYYVTSNEDKLILKDVVTENFAEASMNDFLNNYNAFETAVRERDFERISKLIDISSFANYYLLNEFAVNPDAYWTSFFMYKDGSQDKIHAGPGWDFDYAFANRAWENWMGEEFYSPTRNMVRKDEILSEEEYMKMGLSNTGGTDWYKISQSLSRIIYDLMEIPEFENAVRRIYIDKMKGQKDRLLSIIEVRANMIEEAVLKDEDKWSGEGFWQEVKRMKEWISKRYDYFDEVYGN